MPRAAKKKSDRTGVEAASQDAGERRYEAIPEEAAPDDGAGDEFVPDEAIEALGDSPESDPREAARATSPTMREIFGPGGALEKCMPRGYEYRRSQLEMAELVESGFCEKRHVIVEAGTGTGKTLAYLVPAIRSGQRVVISTATKSLQEQLYEKDIPFLQKHFARELKVAVMKGRGNFLCRDKVYRMADQPILKGFDELDWFQQIKNWEKVTETGDRAELNFLPDSTDLWQKIDARRDTCSGSKCSEFSRCFITAMHQRAAAADLIIVNHHLFFADLALKQDDFGSILPEYSAVIFDEAHEIEDVASEYFGRQVSNYRCEELARDAELAMRVTRISGAGLLRRVARLRERAREFFEAFPAREGRFPFEHTQRATFVDQHRDGYDGLINALKSVEAEIAALPSKPDELLNIARRGMELRAELSFLFESSEGSFVYWFERRGKGLFVAATPIDVSALLRERLFESFETVVLTSATLAVGGGFDFLKRRLGVQASSERVLPSEFDFPTQALLYIPPKLPDVRDPKFPESAAGEIARLLEISEGRAFCLFTSHNQMNYLYERLRSRVPFPLLIQGSAPRSALLEKFRNTPNAVLFATSSFWQGVDVRGEQLCCVIVDRLPFAVPSDPIVAARVRALQEDGRNPFAEYQVPEAVLALKQGFGRLIRSRTDYGVLAILDNRIQRMQYGKLFLESLPAYATTRDIAAVERFMRKPR